LTFPSLEHLEQGQIASSRTTPWVSTSARASRIHHSWMGDPARLGSQPGERALDAGILTGWVAGDEVYGADPGLRDGLEEWQMSYVLVVAKGHPVTTAAGAVRADAVTRKLPPRAWQRLSAGAGAKGQRWYDWAWAAINPGVPGCHWLLVRRHRRTGELAYYRGYCPRPVPVAVRVRAAGRRWTVEEDFQASKGLAALDEHQVRTWTSWYRWVTLAMLALAFLTMAALAEHAHPPPAGLVHMAAPPPAHRPHRPLPAASSQ
jgi:SRSO17 transposase